MTDLSGKKEKTVIIMGGGVAGLSAAHELLKKGFHVTIIEKRNSLLGGKARSMEYYHHDLRGSLPAEHGFRFFPGFYGNITRTMKEIKLKNGKSVFDNLIPVKYYTFLFADGRDPVNIPLYIGHDLLKGQVGKVIRELKILKQAFDDGILKITNAGRNNFIDKIIQLYTSCDQRYLTEYERIPWEEFIEANNPDYGEDYKLLLAEGLTKNLVACRADKSSTRTGGKILAHMLWQIINPTGNADRVLNAPTQVAWITPWENFLKSSYPKQLNIVQEHTVESLIARNKVTDVKSGTLDAVEIKDCTGSVKQLEADYYIAALPIEKLVKLIGNSPGITHIDPTLGLLKRLESETEWMNGIIFYLKIDAPINDGHVTIVDSPFAITIISQTQYWKEYLADNPLPYFRRDPVQSVWSVIISDWDGEGMIHKGRSLKQMTEMQVKEEIWEQLKRCRIPDGKGGYFRLNDNDCCHELTFLDDSIVSSGASDSHQLCNTEPLLINTVVSHMLRPDAHTRVDNFFLASDFVKTNSDLADMDTANEAARRAANNILDREKRRKMHFGKIASYRLPSLLGLFSIPRLLDENNYKHGLPWERPQLFYWFCRAVILLSLKIIRLPRVILVLMLPLGLGALFLIVVVNFVLVILWRVFNAVYDSR